MSMACSAYGLGGVPVSAARALLGREAEEPRGSELGTGLRRKWEDFRLKGGKCYSGNFRRLSPWGKASKAAQHRRQKRDSALPELRSCFQVATEEEEGRRKGPRKAEVIYLFYSLLQFIC